MFKKILNSKAILYVLITGLAFFLFQNIQENNALQDAVKVLEADFEAQRERNQIQFDSVQLRIDEQSVIVGQLETDLSKLDQKKETINQESDEEKDRIARITDADSLAALLSRRYR